jgi:hypothetical protein
MLRKIQWPKLEFNNRKVLGTSISLFNSFEDDDKVTHKWHPSLKGTFHCTKSNGFEKSGKVHYKNPNTNPTPFLILLHTLLKAHFESLLSPIYWAFEATVGRSNNGPLPIFSHIVVLVSCAHFLNRGNELGAWKTFLQVFEVATPSKVQGSSIQSTYLNNN